MRGAGAMPGRKRDLPADAARLVKRRRLGPLSSLRVSPKIIQRYVQCGWWFALWLLHFQLPLAMTPEQLDLQVQEYLEQLWDNNADQSVAANTISAVQHFLRNSCKLKGSWKLLTQWRKAEPSCRAPPMSEAIAKAMAMSALLAGDVGFAISMLLGFYAYLRTGEIQTLCFRQLVFSTDGSQLVLALGKCKSGKRKNQDEFVTLDHQPTIAITIAFVKNKPGNHLVCGVTPARWRQLFQHHLAGLHLGNVDLRPYSLRRGGATHAFSTTNSMSLVLERGRWAHTSTARIYVMEGLAIVQNTRLSAQQRQVVTTMGALWGYS